MKHETFTFNSVPAGVQELSLLPEAVLTSPFAAAALSVLAFCRYGEDTQAAIDMINFLKGPQPLSNYDIQFLRDRLAGKGYKPFSFFEGSSPQNNYTPAVPYTITVSDNPYSYNNEGYATLYLKSSGADSERPVTLRKKGEQWFLWQITFLSDIRTPAADDAWA
ncbi:MAG: hypothetical protein IJR45_07650 [Firmicutes bacterium]|nr:hypothetical protein [Bacillota bacterium]MBQ9605271.1 hypothetical protein [Bacillota bacterium]